MFIIQNRPSEFRRGERRVEIAAVLESVRGREGEMKRGLNDEDETQAMGG